jgi:hypothetical protein
MVTDEHKYKRQNSETHVLKLYLELLWGDPERTTASLSS